MLSSINIILFLCLKAFTSQACYINAFLLGTSLANLFAPWGRRVLVHALLPGTRRYMESERTFEHTVKPANSGHSRETENVAVIDRWLLFTGSF